MSEETQQRYWHAYISMPPEPARTYRNNKTLGIVAPDMDAVIEIIKREYPGAKVWTINHRGEVHHSVIDYKGGEYHDADKMNFVKH